jgi:tetratricopeptide (TPR) repeat protein
MDLRKVLPRKGVTQETLATLSPVFIGEILFKKQHYEQALGKYREALENFPPHSGGRFLVYNKMGIAYEKLERFKRAIEVYEQGVKEGTITPFTYQRLASLYLDSDKLKKALDYCKAGTRCLKRSKTDFFQEIYFWFIFQKLKRKIRRRRKQIGGV